MTDTAGEKVIRLSGRVVDVLEGGRFTVDLGDNRCVNAESSARIKVRLERVQRGDEVVCEQSPYESSKIRIVQVIRRDLE